MAKQSSIKKTTLFRDIVNKYIFSNTLDNSMAKKTNDLVDVDLQVYTTTDYFLFKPIDGNRTKSELHLSRLKKSMSENYLFTVIVVNENYEIIDGQHRFECIKELGLPLHYIICNGYGLDEVHILNQNAKIWNADDYLEGYCNLGMKEYLIYRDFKEKYNIGHSECMGLLTGLTAIGAKYKPFHTGQFKATHLKQATDVMEKVLQCEPYYKGVRRRSFIYTISKLLKNENFNFNEFVQKLKLQPSSLHDCINVNQYKLLIEDIYNYKRRKKVNLRF